MAIADQDGSLEPWAPRWPPPCPESSGSVPGAPAPAPALPLQNWAVHKRHLGLGQCGTLKLMDRQRLGLSKLWAGKRRLGGGKRVGRGWLRGGEWVGGGNLGWELLGWEFMGCWDLPEVGNGCTEILLGWESGVGGGNLVLEFLRHWDLSEVRNEMAVL